MKKLLKDFLDRDNEIMMSKNTETVLVSVSYNKYNLHFIDNVHYVKNQLLTKKPFFLPNVKKYVNLIKFSSVRHSEFVL